MESRDMTPAELKRLLKEELLTEEHIKERDEIEKLLDRSAPAENNSTMKEINLSDLFAARRAKQAQEQGSAPVQMPEAAQEETPAQQPQLTGRPMNMPRRNVTVDTPHQTNAGGYVGKYAAVDSAAAADDVAQKMREVPHTRGKYEKVSDVENPINPAAQIMKAEAPKTRGKYEKVDEDEEVDLPQQRVYVSAAERRRRSKRNMMIIRVLIGFACVFLVGLVVGLIVNTLQMKNSEEQSNISAAVVQSGVSLESTVAVDATSTEPAETTAVTSKCSILSITPIDDYHAVPVGKELSLQVSMTTTGQASAADLLWISSDEEIATVSENGIVTGVKAGECVITVAAKADESICAEIPCIVRSFEERDGVTYIDGIMLINKTFGAPADFDPGMDENCEEAFNKLASDAAEAGLDIYIGSSYRDYWYQDTIYNNYVDIYGWEMVDTFSARPGHSEHQTGLTIDVNTIDDAFGLTAEAAWLKEHCAEYGFIIRFPEDKVDITGYKYEPWHIRYVGVDVATRMNELGLCLEEYLGVDSAYQQAWGEDQH